MKTQNPIFAIVTPFTNDTKAINVTALNDYMHFLNHNDVPTIVTNGTTGEFASMSVAERKQVLEIARATFRGTVINHISSCAIAEAIDMAQHSAQYADAVLLLPPFYFAGVTDNGVMDYFSAIIEHCTLPVYLYNFPRHTKVNITPQMLQTLAARHSNIVGIKDSSGDYELSKSYKALCPDMAVYVGKDSIALQVLVDGLDGSVTGSCNPIPEALVGINQCFVDGNMDDAQKHQESIQQWSAFLNTLNGDKTAATKVALSARILSFPQDVRPPLPNVAASVLASIKTTTESMTPEVGF